MKRLLSVLLALVLSVGIFAGCQKTETTEPEPTEPEIPKVEDDGVMKILLIGHSLGVDSIFMFPDVVKNEGGFDKMVVGFLYHSGCRVAQHVEYAKQNARQYAYYEYDISTQDQWLRADCNGNFSPCAAGAANDIYIEDGSIAQTLEFGIQRHDWDLVILQGGSHESAGNADSWYNTNGKQPNLTGYIQELKDYVNETDIEKGSPFQFAWNMVWTPPADRSVRKDSTNQLLDLYYGGDENLLYQDMAKVLKDTVETNFQWEYVFPNATVIQNIKSTTLDNLEIYRDYAHVTDFGRLAAAYSWYCVLTGKDITECEIPAMNHKVLLNKVAYNTGVDMELSEEYRAILIEAVGNAIANPYAVTPSAY